MDISRRKTAENEVRNSEENFRNLADNSPNMIFIVCNNKIVYVNEKCVEIMKYPREVFLSHGFTFMKLLAPKSRDAARRAFLKHSNNEEVRPQNFSFLTSDGNILETVIATRVIRLTVVMPSWVS
jgi:PAS domain S-box-containing protein